MIAGLLSPSSRYSRDFVFELFYFVALHGRTDLDAVFGLLSQAVEILQLGPVLDTVYAICNRVQEVLDGMSEDPLISYHVLVFVAFLD
jgi:hypothetical protein